MIRSLPPTTPTRWPRPTWRPIWSLKIEPAKQSAAWFDEHTKALRAPTLKPPRPACWSSSAATGLVGDEKLDLESARLTELSTQYTAIQAQSTETTSRQRQGGSANEVTASPLVQALKVDLARSQALRAFRLSRREPSCVPAREGRGGIPACPPAHRIRQRGRGGGHQHPHQPGPRRRRQEPPRSPEQRVLQLKQQRDEMGVLQREVDSARPEGLRPGDGPPDPDQPRASRARATWPCRRWRCRPPQRPARCCSTWVSPSSSAPCWAWQ